MVSDVKVEQDYLLCRALEAIFEDRFLASQVAMRGGTVLHKGRLAPATRYSEDIDLVLVGERAARRVDSHSPGYSSPCWESQPNRSTPRSISRSERLREVDNHPQYLFTTLRASRQPSRS